MCSKMKCLVANFAKSTYETKTLTVEIIKNCFTVKIPTLPSHSLPCSQ